MEVFRIVHEIHSLSLNSSGSPNRWNLRGQHVIYTGSSRSLSTLELVVHKSSVIPALNYKVIAISIADYDSLQKQIYINELPINWRSMAAYSRLQEIGSSWYSKQESLVLKVPSAVIPYEYNYVINSEHPHFNEHVKIIRTEDYFWDNRLI
jgi:RES domain-containing protein